MAREDLSVSRTDNPDQNEAVYLVRDPATGEVFEFGLIEYTILSRLDGVTDSPQIIAELPSEFGASITVAQFEQFVSMLARWGLLQNSVHAPPSPVLTRSPRSQGQSVPFPRRQNRRAGGSRGHHEPSLQDASLYDDGSSIGGVDSGVGPRRSAPPETAQERGHWSWFNPDKLFHGLAVVLRPFRLLAFLLPLVFIVALAAVLQNIHAVTVDLPRVWGPASLAEHILFSLVTVNLVTQVLLGTIARGYGVSGQSFGMRLAFGLIPRFETVIGDISRLPRGVQIWIHLTPLLAGLGLFSLGSLLWLTSRTTGTALYAFAMTLGTVAFVATVIKANPLMKGNGYYVVAAFLEFPDLRQKAFVALFSRFSRRRSLHGRDAEHQLALRSYALACLIFIVSVFGFILYVAASWLELLYQGTGVFLFLVLFTYLVWRFKKLRARRVEMRRQRHAQVGPAAQHQALAPAVDLQLDTLHRAPYILPHTATHRKTRWLGAVLVGVVLSCAFLPYPYETGGPATSLPVRQQQVHAETTGIVEKVHFRGGEWVPGGTVIGALSSYEQQKNVSVTTAAIQEQQAKLERLLSTPTKEELDVAEKELQTTLTQAKYSVDKAKRFEKLFSKGHVSQDDYEDAMRKQDLDEMQVIEAQANFDLVKSGVHPKEIEAARSELVGLQQQLAFYQEQLQRTALIMPADGRLVTPDLHLKTGRYLDKGDLFVVTEDDRTVRVEISVPESDIADVEIGNSIRLKIWTYPDHVFEGTVTEIAPVVSAGEQGKIVRVIGDIPNPDGLIKSGMSGFGKIEGGEKPAYVAFTRMFVRFVLIEAWSWLP